MAIVCVEDTPYPPEADRAIRSFVYAPPRLSVHSHNHGRLTRSIEAVAWRKAPPNPATRRESEASFASRLRVACSHCTGHCPQRSDRWASACVSWNRTLFPDPQTAHIGSTFLHAPAEQETSSLCNPGRPTQASTATPPKGIHPWVRGPVSRRSPSRLRPFSH